MPKACQQAAFFLEDLVILQLFTDWHTRDGDVCLTNPIAPPNNGYDSIESYDSGNSARQGGNQ
jgi:hypothetical protein